MIKTYHSMVDAKLNEELSEYHKDQDIEELADLMEVSRKTRKFPEKDLTIRSNGGLKMDIERAKELLTILANGVNPLTGEVLTDDDSCNRVEIVRALNTVLRALDNQPKKSSKPLPENAGKPWAKEDDEALCCMFDAGCTRKEICNHFKRSNGAIAARLVKLCKINERDEFRNRKD